MRSLGLSLLTALLMVVATGTAALAADSFRVLRADDTSVEVEITTAPTTWESVPGEDGRSFRRPRLTGGLYRAAPGAPDVPSLVRLVGLPWEGGARVRVLSVDPVAEPARDLAPGPEPVIETPDDIAPYGSERRVALAATRDAGPTAWAEIGRPFQMRGQRMAHLILNPYRYDAGSGQLERARRLVVRVEFDAPESASRGVPTRDHAAFERSLDSNLLNADAARAWRRPKAAPLARGGTASFNSSPNWLRIPVTQTGIYRLDYFTFSNAGVDPATIDPRTVRVFAGENLPLDEVYDGPPPSFMTECALLALDDAPVSDGVFDLDDRFLLYAHGTSGWASEFDPTLPRTEWLDNPYTDVTYYWITWGGSFPAAPRRMTQRFDLAPADTALDVATLPWREHFEENNLEEFRYPAEDGWQWESLFGRGQDRLYLLNLDRVAAVGEGGINARVLSYGRNDEPRERDVELKVQGQIVADSVWTHGGTRAVVDLQGCYGDLLISGPNAIRINAREILANSLDKIYTAWFDIEYNRILTTGPSSSIRFLAPVTIPPEITPACSTLYARYGARDFLLQGFRTTDPLRDVYLFDVTDQHDVHHLKGFQPLPGTSTSNISFQEYLGGDRWYIATTMEGVLPHAPAEVMTFPGLRDTGNGAEYLVIYHEDFAEGAQRLADLRGGPSGGQLRTKIVDVQDVYNEFSWGLNDLTAIRDFLAYTQVHWSLGSPLYVAIVGDAAYDTKQYLAGSPPNLIGSYLGRYRTEPFVQYVAGENLYFYSTDDYFGYADSLDYAGTSQAVLDFAIGRYPVSTPEDLDLLLDKLDSYLAYEMPGQWQNRVLLTADDERTLSESSREPYHTEQVETLARERVPPSMDAVKVYLTEFPRNTFGKKPEAQAKFIEEFTRGALMVTYTGHGDQNTMAQEEVFVGQKIPELLNEERYTVFSTFSCTVSRFDLLSGNSMTERILLHGDGGAVTTFASGGLVFPQPSSLLNQEWLGFMFGTPYPINTWSRSVHSIGLSGMWAKTIVATVGQTRINNEKYVLLGDPALEVRYGRSPIRFEAVTIDSQVTDGTLRVIRGEVVDSNGVVLDGSGAAPAFNGTAYVHVTGQADTSGYIYDGFGKIDYVLEGATAFRGQTPVVGGRFETKFHLSEAIQSGNNARVSVFALERGPDPRDASGAADSLLVAPTISPGQTSDSQGPKVRIRFEGYDNFVNGDFIFTDKPILTVDLEDESGINPLPFPEFAQLSARVDDGDQINLAEDFSYLEGSYTHGRVRRILPLAPGPHRLTVKAFDNVGNRGSGEVEFTIVLPSADFAIVDEDVAVYPNPFPNATDFLFRLTHAADVNLKVFTVTGRKIYEKGTFRAVADMNTVRWEGRDDRGRPLANGTYLYKLEASYTNDDGELESDEFVGHVVKMR